MTKPVIILFGLLLGFVLAGCEDANRKSPLQQRNESLTLERIELKRQIEQTKDQNEQLQKQVQALTKIRPEVRLENLYNLQKVRIGRYTNLFDKDGDGKKEKLIVYIQPLDEEGDIIKASGMVDVRLWDLNKQSEKAMLGQWHVGPAKLKKLWFATLITINYRLTFDISDKIEKFDEPLTVKVTFTDYLTGKIFKEQKVIKP